MTAPATVPRAEFATAGAAMRGAIDTALADPDLTLGEARVLLALVRDVGTYSRTTDRVYRARLAELAHASERTVGRALRRLDEVGAITYDAGNGRGRPSRVVLETTGKGDTALSPFETGKGDTEAPERATPRCPAYEKTSREDLLPLPPAETAPPEPLSAQAAEEGPTEEDPQTADRFAVAAELLLDAVPEDVRRRARTSRHRWRPQLAAALDAGWTAEQLVDEVARQAWTGVRSPFAVFLARLAGAAESAPPAPASTALPLSVPWCGSCDSPGYRWRIDDDERATPCPTCSPQATRPRLDAVPGGW